MRTVPANHSEPELPILRLGLAGFTREEEATICVELARRAAEGRMVWQVSSLGEADAWFAHGGRLRCLPDGTWRIVGAHALQAPVRVNPDDIDRPIAFSMPAGPPGFDPPYRFDLASPATIPIALEQLEGWLRPLMIQFSLASHIVRSELDLGDGAYHVTVQGRLYAVVSRRTGVGVWAIADPARMDEARWHHRPESADAMPSMFIRVRLAEVMWQYATRTTRDLLPAHYRRKRLYLRRMPPIAIRLLCDKCLLLVRELARAPGTLHDLVQRTGTPAGELARQVAALWIVGAVTANPSRLAPPAGSDWNSSLGAQDETVAADLVTTVRLQAIGDQTEAMN